MGRQNHIPCRRFCHLERDYTEAHKSHLATFPVPPRFPSAPRLIFGAVRQRCLAGFLELPEVREAQRNRRSKSCEYYSCKTLRRPSFAPPPSSLLCCRECFRACSLRSPESFTL